VLTIWFYICSEFAKEYDILFNADKSKCIISHPRGAVCRANLGCDVCFSVSGNVIENVDSLPHLCHIITNTGID